ncbi:NAD(P)/FAD-dependent oxidoreductase [bacterium]|nr:NAD(P)/FAD-dependent oxidoreductase [bacterium]
MMIPKFDVVVVGAGPAGSSAAREAARNGAKVLMLEKDREVGLPVRCAEGVAHQGLSAAVDEINPSWISQKIVGFQLISPDLQNVKVDWSTAGYVLNRKVFDYDLARMAADAGAEIRTKSMVTGLEYEDGVVSGVKVSSLRGNYSVQAKVVIGADGVESRVGRWAGLRQAFQLKDIESCAQVTAANIDVDANYCHFYFGTERAPGGYVWIFPRGNGLCNIGLGIGGDRITDKKPIHYLHQFLDEFFPGVAVLTTVAGGVPCAPELRELTGDGIMLAGDAAHQVNPISGGGIVLGMLGGKIAGRIAANAIGQGDVSAAALRQYTKEWFKGNGRKHKMYYRLKKGVYSLTDGQFNETAKIINSQKPGDRNLVSIFKAALFNKPSLILDVIRAFS